MKNRKFFESSLMVAPINEADLAAISGGQDPTPKVDNNTSSFWIGLGKTFLTKAAEESGKGAGGIIWLVPTTIIAEFVRWSIGRRLRRRERKENND